MPIQMSLTPVEAELVSRVWASAEQLEARAHALRQQAIHERVHAVQLVAAAHEQDPKQWGRVARVEQATEGDVRVLRVTFDGDGE